MNVTNDTVVINGIRVGDTKNQVHAMIGQPKMGNDYRKLNLRLSFDKNVSPPTLDSIRLVNTDYALTR